MLGKSLELGELYKELRIARGLKLKDVARENLSISQLSKFENGQTMLAADKLLLAIQGIHMSFSEFSYALTHYQMSDFFQTGKKIAALQTEKDIEGLKRLLEESRELEFVETYNRLNSLVIQVAINGLDSDYQVANQEIEFLSEYLYSIEEWTEYELYIFGNTMAILSSEDIIFLGKAFVERDKLYSSIPSHRKNAEIVFLNLILVLVERRKLYYASYFIDKLEGILTYQDMFAIVSLNFFKKIIIYLNGEESSLSAVNSYINLVNKIGNPTLAMFLELNLNQILYFEYDE